VVIDRSSGNSPGIGVEIIASGKHSNIFVVHQKCEDAYKGIDIAVHKLERQLRRKKTKQRNNKHIND